MDPILKLYEAMKAALQSGHSVEEVNQEIARRGFTINGNPATFVDLSNRAQQVLDEQSRGSRGTPGEIASTAASALTLGVGPKVAAGALSLFPGQGTYREALDRIRAPIESLRHRRPGVSASLEVGTGLATLPLIPGPARARSLMDALKQGVGTGAAYGAVSGAGNAEPGEELAGALKGGAVGSAVALPFAVASRAIPSLMSAKTRAANRLESAIAAEGGPDAVRAAAGRSIAAGRGNVNPIGSLGPYLRGESEFAATRSPSVFGKFRAPMVSRQSDEADRLLRDVSGAFGEQSVGREALAANRRAQFDPVYEALNKTAGKIEDPRIPNILARPVVKTAYQEAINTGVIADQVESLPSFGQLNELRESLYSKARQLEATPGGDKRRMAALYDAAREVESVLEDNVDEFRALQNAYRESSRPINVIDLARLETAKAGRVSPALDRASREDRRALLRAFGSSDKYKQFMNAVEQERQLAEFNAQAFGGSATARRLEGTPEMRPEDVAHAVAYPVQGATNAAGRALGRSSRDATARAMAPALFAPSRDIDRVLAALANRSRMGEWIGQRAFPASGGLLGSFLMNGDQETDINGYPLPRNR